MPAGDAVSLWNAVTANALNPAAELSKRFIAGADRAIALSAIEGSSCLAGRAGELRGRSVLIATSDQFLAALALLELDGIARRMVLWPADLPAEHLSYVIESATVDAIVSDGTMVAISEVAVGPVVMCAASAVPAGCDRDTASLETEWVLLTSGTTGRPKMVVHTLASLSGAIQPAAPGGADSVVWSTFYDIRRYGGLQIFLRAMLAGGSLVLSCAGESTAEFLARAGRHNINHISGTPSHWRRALMSPCAKAIRPRYVRLSGEIADQSILDALHSCYPDALIAHAFASTEAGVAFDVRDGKAGFPASLLGARSGVEMKVDGGTLRIRSSRIADRYIRHEAKIADSDGFVDTGDLVERRGDRYCFVGRRDGMINVGGQKVHPEEVEDVINRHPDVRMSRVRARKNPVLGALVVADIVLEPDRNSREGQARSLEREILHMCREALPRHKVPAAIKFVPELDVASTGKIVRHA